MYSCMENLNLFELENISNDLEFQQSYSIFKGSCKYYHYNCDNFNDIGWGCGYRTLQTMCSWIRERLLEKSMPAAPVPSLIEIQKILHKCEDKPANFVNSKQWIGCFEASIVIDYLYDVPCKILHCTSGTLLKNISELSNHFKTNRSPLMMGGDLDSGSKCILGIKETTDQPNDPFLLVADPHLSNRNIDRFYLFENGWIKWKQLSEVENNQSFYNFCMPQFKF